MLFACYAVIEMMQLAAIVYIFCQVFYEEEALEKIRTAVFLGIYAVLNAIHIENMWDSYISNMSIIIESLTLGLACSWYFKKSFLSAFTLFLWYFSNISLLRFPVLIMEGIKNHSNLIFVYIHNTSNYLDDEL